MSAHRALGPQEERRLVDLWREAGTKAAAEAFGVSKDTVRRTVKRLGATRDGPAAARETKAPDKATEGAAGGPQDRPAKLRDLEGLLRAALRDCQPGALASLSREYRAVLDEIERLEGGGDDDPFELLADSIAAKLSP